MGRYKESVGGWFRVWSRQWLTDEKISCLTDAEQGQLVRLLSVANECWSEGRFEVIGIALSLEQVTEKASVSIDFIKKMSGIGLVEMKPFSVKNWEKWQNPDSGRDRKQIVKRK